MVDQYQGGPSFSSVDPRKEFTVNETVTQEMPAKAKLSQVRQQLHTAESEINELRQSLRYVEISLAKQREEKEAGDLALAQSKKQQEAMEEENKAKDKEIGLQEQQIQTLNKKITKFNSNNEKIKEKNTFKATRYQGEINKQEEEVAKMRDRMQEVEEEMKTLALKAEKFRLERDYLHRELKVSEVGNRELKTQLDAQSRLLTNVSTHNKNHADQMRDVPDSSGRQGGERANVESQRSERIAGTMNRGSFMPLGENPPKLYSEQDPAMTKQVQMQLELPDDPFTDKNHLYLTDDSVPTPVYQCIDAYREKVRLAGGQPLLVDDFFGAVHNILKDTHLREIARIRNENTVEIMRLKKALNQKESNGKGMTPSTSTSSFKSQMGQLGKTSFADNEMEKQRRNLVSANVHLEKRVNALENLMRTGTDGRKKFMEGAHWLAVKSKAEQEKLSNKLIEIVHQYVAMMRDAKSKEYDGSMVENTINWVVKQIQRQAEEGNQSYETLLENVNFFLNEAQRNLKLK